MLHAKVIDTKKEKIDLSKAEEFISSSKFGASIFFTGTVRKLALPFENFILLRLFQFFGWYCTSSKKTNLSAKAILWKRPNHGKYVG